MSDANMQDVRVEVSSTYLYTRSFLDLLDDSSPLVLMRARLCSLGLEDLVGELDALIEALDLVDAQVAEGEKILGRIRPVLEAVGREAGPEVMERALSVYRCEPIQEAIET